MTRAPAMGRIKWYPTSDEKVRGWNNNNSDLYLPTSQISVGSDVSQTTSPVPTAYRHLVRMILVML